MLERPMEVSVMPHENGLQVQNHGAIFAWLHVRLVNHNTSTPQRISGCRVELKKRNWVLWRKALTTAAVIRRDGLNAPITDILLPPMSSPLEIELWANGSTRDISLPHESWLVLIFDMVGPIRKIERELTRVLHEPAKSA